MEADGVDFSGRTVEDALRAAESALQTSRDILTVEVLTHGSRGVFGIGAEDARIRVRRVEPAPPPPPAPQELPVSSPEVEAAADHADPQPDSLASGGDYDDYPEDEDAEAGNAARFPPITDLPEESSRVLRDLLHAMGFDAEVTVRSSETPVVLEVQGENLGALIGRRGDNLSALQFMVNLILARGRRAWPRVVIDVENYRSRREDSLRALAERTAYRVQRNGRPFTLEAMPASDRRVIHLTLRERPGVETYSIGEGPARRVVIAPKQGSRSQAPSTE